MKAVFWPLIGMAGVVFTVALFVHLHELATPAHKQAPTPTPSPLPRMPAHTATPNGTNSFFGQLEW